METTIKGVLNDLIQGVKGVRQTCSEAGEGIAKVKNHSKTTVATDTSGIRDRGNTPAITYGPASNGRADRRVLSAQ